MYIVNQDNTKITKIETVKIYSCYHKDIQDELNKIYNRRMDKVYNYGSTDR